MVLRNNIVSVQFKNRYSGEYGGKKYNYYTEVPLKVGQIVKVNNKYGESKVRVSDVGINEGTLPGVLRARLVTLTQDNLLIDENGLPEMDNQQTLDDFFNE